ncbi:hypothetical protein N9M57_03870 [Opitutales bacterium]|nr:hypothetical protein [Opitutales bacterium]
MLLSEVLKLSGGSRLARDASFSNLGKTAHQKEAMLSFVESAQYLQGALLNKNVTSLIVARGMVDSVPESYGVIETDSPRELFYDIHQFLFENTEFYAPKEGTVVSDNAVLHPSAIIDPLSVKIEKGVIIEAGVIIHSGTTISEGAIIRSGSIIGSEGFEFYRSNGKVRPVPHSGGVFLGPGVEVQSATVIEKSVYGANTVVGEDSKLGAKVLLAHNCRVGKRCLLAGGVVVSGNVVIGDGVWIGPGAVVSSGLRIEDFAKVTLGTTVISSVKSGSEVTGVFGSEKHRMMKFMAKSGLI